MATDSTRVAVVTGASSGIGREVAKALAALGWHVIGTGRDPARIAAAKDEIAARSRTGQVDMIRADLSLLASARDTARQIAALTDRVDLLVNNAGGMVSEMVMTSEGLEANFAGNHLGPFVLTNALLPLLRTAAQSSEPGAVRILNTASDASEMIPFINLDDLQSLAAFSPGLAYCTGKLANVLFAKALAQRLAEDGIVAHAVHPGAVDSNFFSYAPKDTQMRSRDLAKASEEEGADTLVWLATADEAAATSGGYWFRRAPRTPNPVAQDQAVIDRFWEESERLAGERSPGA
ncbi:SDR family NAD(P)-dependent oxidoreductase [Novosphingobium sp. P6W]|uniref:SDR family NAD(P)-dependent oxidoreductase n=1 Tax=Novosphingobium sp. P6W TaxID=1609758 RepID=UPI0005C2DB76|nr:SDR family NAD(P)-dependent oxidoreductase [Novosphingobium sp. P6W]KIS34364.1 short-chain dehydrogenase [Novosphingobium sp. P6W]